MAIALFGHQFGPGAKTTTGSSHLLWKCNGRHEDEPAGPEDYFLARQSGKIRLGVGKGTFVSPHAAPNARVALFSAASVRSENWDVMPRLSICTYLGALELRDG